MSLLEETSGFLSSGGEAAELSVLMFGRDDPVDAGISSDGTVVRVDHNDFIEFERGILSDPV